MDIGKIDAAALLNSIEAGVVVHAPDTSILYANPKALELLRLSEAQALGKDVFDSEWRFIDTHKHPMPVESYPVNKVIYQGRRVQNDVLGIVDSTSERVTWVMVNAYSEHTDDGALAHVVVTFVDITHDQKEIPFEEIVAYANDAVVVTEARPVSEPGPRIVYVNNAFVDITGYLPEEVVGKSPRILQGEDTDPEMRARIRKALLENRPVRGEILNYSKRGRPYWLDLNIVPLRNKFGEVTFFAAIERDITDQKEHENYLQHLAANDPLTGLKNRRGFAEQAGTLLSNAKRQGTPISLAVIDIDHFKSVNDTYGHDVGDEALVFLSQLMQTTFRESDVLARLGGEEFVVLLCGTEGDGAEALLQKFRSKVESAEIVTKSEETLSLTVSIGYAALGLAPIDIEALITRADKALYHAKDTGRNKVCSDSPVKGARRLNPNRPRSPGPRS